jgi:hypothetical protein
MLGLFFPVFIFKLLIRIVWGGSRPCRHSWCFCWCWLCCFTFDRIVCTRSLVQSHLTTYSGGRNDNLFVGAIGESVFFPSQPQVSQLEWQYERFVNETGCSSSTDSIACLRGLDTATLQAANVPSPYPGQSGSSLFYWTPTIDGNFIQEYPYLLFEQGRFVKVPIIFGGDCTDILSFDSEPVKLTISKMIQTKAQILQPTPPLQLMCPRSSQTTTRF